MKRQDGVVSLFVLLSCTTSVVFAQTPTVGKWERHVIALSNASYSGNPFGLEVDGIFTHTSGTTIQNLPGYYDGNNIWKIGFMPTLTGTWTYVTHSTDPDLDGKTGTINVIESGRPGMLKADTTNRKKWKYADGPYVVPIAFRFDLLDPSITSQRFTEIANFLKDDVHGTMLERTLSHESLSNTAPNECPYTTHHEYFSGNPLNNQFNLIWWQRLEERMEILAERGLGFHFMFYADAPGAPDWLPKSSTEKLLIRYTVARLAGYPVLFINSGIDIGEYRDDAWADWLGTEVQRLDPYNHPVSSRRFQTVLMDSRTFDSRVDTTARINNMISFYTTETVPVSMDDAWSENSPEAAKRSKDFTHHDIRRSAWKAVAAGGLSVLYRGRSTSGLYCGDLFFLSRNFETELESEQWLGLVNPFIQNKLGTTFGSMVPAATLVSGNDIYALADPARINILYVLMGVNDRYDPGGGNITVKLSSVSGTYQATWFDPRTGTESSAGTLAGGFDYPWTPPSQDDWVLLLTAMNPPARCLGDITQDGTRDLSDAVRCIRHLLGLETLTGNELLVADANQDGSVDLSDVIRIIRDLLGLEPLPVC